MSFASIRKNLGLSQAGISILFGISVGNIRNWEQGLRSPDSAAITLYRLIEKKDQGVLVPMLTIACQKNYHDLKEAKSLKRMISKLVEDKLLKSLMEKRLLECNRQWRPEDLGFRVTRIQF